MRHTRILLLFLALYTAGCSKSAQDPEPPPAPVSPDVYKADNNVVAHRGAWKEFGLPDNSIAALKKAMEFNSYASECDIQLTRDNKVIVYHDETIGGQFIKDLNYDQLVSHTLSNGEAIPLLTEFLDQVINNKKIMLWIDIKSLSDAAGGNNWAGLMAEQAAAIVRDKKAQKQVAFIVGRKAVLDNALNAVRGEWPCGYMNTAYTPENFVSAGYTWANFMYSTFYTNATTTNQALLNAYSDRDIELSVYTVDDDQAMNWFIAQPKVKAITTNYPLKLVQRIRNRN